MARPGVNITNLTSRPASGAPTNTGVLFVTGQTERGPLSPVHITSLTDFERTFGTEVSFSVLHPALSSAFREGLREAYVQRVVGPAPVSATVSLLDASSAIVVTLKALSVGQYANDFKAAVVSATGGTQVVLTKGADVLETSPVLATKADVLAWASRSSYVTATTGASSNAIAVAAAASFTGGTADSANISDASHATALSAFSKDLGPGQVIQPGRTTYAAWSGLLAHAAATNRFAICDAPDTTVPGTLVTAGNTFQADANSSYGMLVGNWGRVAGPSGTTKSVPPSAIHAGIEARRDAVASPGTAAAFRKYPSNSLVSLNGIFTDADTETILYSGVVLFKNSRGSIFLNGYRSGAPLTSQFVQANYSRLRMALTARAEATAEAFQGVTLDGRGIAFEAFGGALKADLLKFYNDNVLYGEDPTEAFDVITDSSVNTPESIANGDLRAAIVARFSPHAEAIYITITKVPTTESIN